MEVCETFNLHIRTYNNFTRNPTTHKCTWFEAIALHMAPRQKGRYRFLASLFGKPITPPAEDKIFLLSPPPPPPPPLHPLFPLFPLFTKLPPELQIEIWYYLLKAPSKISHKGHSRLYTHTRTSDNHFIISWSRCFDLSPAIHVNRFSRQVAFEYYLSLPQIEGVYCGRAWSHYREVLRYFRTRIDRKTKQWIPRTEEVDLLVFDYSHFGRWSLEQAHQQCTAIY